MRRRLRVVLSALVRPVVVTAAYVPAATMKFWFASVRCGHPPVVGFNEGGSFPRYVVAGEYNYGPQGEFDEYFCTTREAEAAGYLPEAFLHA